LCDIQRRQKYVALVSTIEVSSVSLIEENTRPAFSCFQARFSLPLLASFGWPSCVVSEFFLTSQFASFVSYRSKYPFNLFLE